VKTGQKMYALTKEGRRVIRRVMEQESEEAEEAKLQRLPRDMERFVISLLDSSAYQTFEENRKQDLNFGHACRFWGITENMKGDQLDERLAQVEKNLAALDRTSAEADIELSSGRVLSAGDVRVLTNIHRHMEDRFERHLNLLRSRAGKR